MSQVPQSARGENIDLAMEVMKLQSSIKDEVLDPIELHKIFTDLENTAVQRESEYSDL